MENISIKNVDQYPEPPLVVQDRYGKPLFLMGGSWK
jgi:hypothetical protein